MFAYHLHLWAHVLINQNLRYILAVIFVLHMRNSKGSQWKMTASQCRKSGLVNYLYNRIIVVTRSQRNMQVTKATLTCINTSMCSEYKAKDKCVVVNTQSAQQCTQLQHSSIVNTCDDCVGSCLYHEYHEEGHCWRRMYSFTVCMYDVLQSGGEIRALYSKNSLNKSL